MKKKELRKETSKVILIGVVLAVLRWLPTRTYNRMLNKMVKSIHAEAFPMYAQDFVDTVKFSRKVSQGYKNSGAEYEALRNQFTCFKSVYALLSSNVRNYRKKVGLPL